MGAENATADSPGMRWARVCWRWLSVPVLCAGAAGFSQLLYFGADGLGLTDWPSFAFVSAWSALFAGMGWLHPVKDRYQRHLGSGLILRRVAAVVAGSASAAACAAWGVAILADGPGSDAARLSSAAAVMAVCAAVICSAIWQEAAIEAEKAETLRRSEQEMAAFEARYAAARGRPG